MSQDRGFVMVILALLSALLSATLCPASARAHAFLDHAEPRVGSTVAAAPERVILSFTEPIEPSFSRIEVRDAGGRRLNGGTMEHPAPDRLGVALPPLPPGTYHVHWAVTSVDTHQTEGNFQFTVSKP
jgi:methionine-rich copper-binding protein CopC